MRLTVLGRYGPYSPYGGACSGFLLQHDGTNLLLDCGNGVLSRLQKHINLSMIDAVILSHLHSDHIADLFILRYALEATQSKAGPLSIYTPLSPKEELGSLPQKEGFTLSPIDESANLHIGSMELNFLQTKHPVTCFAVQVVTAEEKFVYSADTEYFPELIDFAKDADLFLCEANFLQEDLQQGRSNHLAAYQAGEIAQQAGVKRLLLTHLPAFREIDEYLLEARQIFVPAELAEEGRTYLLGGS